MNSKLADEALDASLDDVEFLARSNHRARVLDALIDGPRERSEHR